MALPLLLMAPSPSPLPSQARHPSWLPAGTLPPPPVSFSPPPSLQDGSFMQSRRIVDRESEYSKRRLDRIISPDRNDAFLMGDKVGEGGWCGAGRVVV